MLLDDLPTPRLVLDRGILQCNLKRMSATIRRHGVSLRPHLKTAKSAEVARLAVAGEAGGITVSTLAEAEYFVAQGLRDITIAAGTTPQKLERVEALVRKGANINVITDDLATATAIAACTFAVNALIEIDSGEARGGVDPLGDDLVDIGRALGERLIGVLTHAGHSYGCRAVSDIRKVAEQERVAAVTAAERLRSAGLRCDVVSVGSTPTMTHAESMEGVTEARPGVYMFGDLFQAEIESCTRADIAVTVLASVIGRRPVRNQLLLDAGALALSKDRSTAATDHDAGFGLVLDIDGKPSYGECIVRQAYQEHGVAIRDSDTPMPFDLLPVGSKVRIAPNHSCLTAAAYERYYVVDGTREVIAEWDRVNGW